MDEKDKLLQILINNMLSSYLSYFNFIGAMDNKKKSQWDLLFEEFRKKKI